MFLCFVSLFCFLYFVKEFLSLYYDALIEIVIVFIISLISKSYFLSLYFTEGTYGSFCCVLF